MLSLLRILLVLTIATVIQYADGNKRIVCISELTSGEGDNTCCLYGNCSCSSLDHALANLTSNVVINIIADVTLSSLIRVSDIENVTVIGHNNPTVNLKRFGGIHLTFCHNCIFQGITWDGCGTENTDNHTEPLIMLVKSSNIIINNCSFQYLKGQAILLSEVSGYVNITHCNFVHNHHYRDHGAAIHYLSGSAINHYELVFIIHHCNFTHNKHANSLVYIENRIFNHSNNITLSYTNFCHNQGISVYAINENLYLKGKSLFHNNSADNGTGIYVSDHSIVVFGENSDVTFVQNSDNLSSRTVFLSNHSNITFDRNSRTTFKENFGTIYSEASSNIIFKAACIVTFGSHLDPFNLINYSISNYYVGCGGAIYSCDHSYIIFEGDSSPVFSKNIATDAGGVIYSYNNSYIIFEGDSSPVFSDNTALKGGAVYSYENSYVIFQGNSSPVFSKNIATDAGGVIYSYNNSYIIFEGDSSPVFSDNTALKGGAIYSYENSYVIFQGNSSPVFSKNIATDAGGVIYSYNNSYIIFEGESSPVFSMNGAIKDGRVIYSYNTSKGNFSPIFSMKSAYILGGTIYSCINSYVSFKESSSAVFSSNYAGGAGAICSCINSYISFKENSSPVFSNNTAIAGGAIYSLINSSISFEEYSFPLFSNNIANATGGAVSSGRKSDIVFEGKSSPVFTNNVAKLGGAIYSHIIVFKGTSTAEFSNNIAAHQGGAIFDRISRTFDGFSVTTFTAKVQGGAIYLRDGSVSFKATSTTLFSNNTATDGGGAICFAYGGNISFEGFSTVVFKNNVAEYGGAMFATTFEYKSDIIFSDNSTVSFTNNNATFGKTVFSESEYAKSKIIAIGNSTVRFNDVSAKWCNNICLPYTGQGNVVMIDNDDRVWCSDQEAFMCLAKECCHNKLEGLFDGLKNGTLVNITDNMTLSSVIKLQSINKFSIIGHNNITVLCANGGGLYLYSCTDFTIKGITWIRCGSLKNAVVKTEESDGITIQKCNFQHSLGRSLTILFHYTYYVKYVNINHCNFINSNHYKIHGTAIYCGLIANITMIIINNSNFSYNKNASSIIAFELHNFFSTHIHLSNSTFHKNQGISVYLATSCFLHISGEVLFKDNIADYGSGIYIQDTSTVIFETSSSVKFINNFVYHSGAAIFLCLYSKIIFKQNSIIRFIDNKATNGTIYLEIGSKILFKGTCEVTFNGNSATQCGAAIYSFYNSSVIFTENSKVTFSSNVVYSNDIDIQHNGTIYSEDNSHVSFEDNSVTVFSNNIADFGAAIFSFSRCIIIFKGSSRVIINSNTAQYCGILTSISFSNIIFKDSTEITYDSNTISHTIIINYKTSVANSAMCTFRRTDVIFSGQSLVRFTNNTAGGGGAVMFSESNVIIEEYSTITFDNNIAQYSSGGAFICYNNSNVTIKGNSNVFFYSNKANQHGGAIYSYNMCKVTFQDKSTSTFINNTARSNGGAILSSELGYITFEGNSTVTFDYNTADNGGALYFTNSTITFKESSTVSFYNNVATQSGGAGYFNSHCNYVMEDNAMVTYDNNRALSGGAICIDNNIKLIFKGTSTSFFYNNLAGENGGAIKVLNNSSIILKNHVTLKFTNNSAAQYGGAIFLDTTAILVSTCNSIEYCINFFDNNIARIFGSSVYKDVAELCNNSCLNNSIIGISNKVIATPPRELKFNDPTICIDNDDDMQCNNYYIQNIMLGKQIIIPVCVLDYYNQSIDAIQFLIQSEANPNYFISGPKHVLISSDEFEGISIIGNQSLITSTNFSIAITLNTALHSYWKKISVNLTIELSPCHPGFWQYPNLLGCECYNASNIVFCSDSSSTIKRGYWFGNVTGKPTVTYCPINYCNFTCCETSSGYYHLSPVRDNQCRSHRSGTACGSCTDDYTLSFDSTECVSMDSCTTGKTILVILLTVIYWIVMVTLVFVMMYYKVGIGYLYSITYYYSIVDILLNQSLQASRGLYLTVSIISSFSKITPQFLGELCLTTGMSGIDQQFIHYIHPSAVLLILVIISSLARRSRRISDIIRRGIIHVICLLLLLSYTSIASTSLLLMRSLKFHEINEVYTYLSPHIEYFHGRHLAYGIVALLCISTIVLGLPLLLTLEPFLNYKFNFIKIKPLLDQFQGCYKDKYRCFAGYYMICRLLIITIVMAYSSNAFVVNYLLVIVCGMTQLIHVMVNPYSKEILNKFDGIILHLIIFVAALPLLDDFDSSIVITTSFVLAILPWLIFTVMTLFLHKDNLRKIITYLTTKVESPNHNIHDVNDDSEMPMKEFHRIIDDSARRKATVTICDMYVSKITVSCCCKSYAYYF